MSQRATLRLLTGAILLVEFLVGQQIVQAPLARADADYTAFYNAVRHDGMTGSDDVLLKNGNWVCVEILTGLSPSAIGREFMKTNNVTESEASHFVDDAARYLCPLYPAGKPPGATTPSMQTGTVV